MPNLSKRQWAWWLAAALWVLIFVLSPVLPKGDLQWFTDIAYNVQWIALWVALFYGSPNKPKEESKD